MTLTVKRGGLVERILRGPTLHRTADVDAATRSRWMYGLEDCGCARLTPLGVLHTLVGLTLVVND